MFYHWIFSLQLFLWTGESLKVGSSKTVLLMSQHEECLRCDNDLLSKVRSGKLHLTWSNH